MPLWFRRAAALAALALFAPAALAQGTCSTGTAMADLDANDVRARMFITGGLFFNGGAANYEVPKGSGVNAIFAAGLWLGGKVDGELRTAAATYAQGGENYEFWPGPLDDDGAPPDDCAAFDRIWLVSQADIEAYDQTGTATPDLAEWPADLGAPVLDGDGDDTNYDLAAGDRPDLRDAAQTAWWVMNDAGNEHATTESAPIGMEVRVQAFSYLPGGDDIPDFVDTATFYLYTLVYKGDAPIGELYASFWSDGDLGNFGDDYIGAAPASSLGYTYNADDDDDGPDGYGVSPPAVGVMGLYEDTAPVLAGPGRPLFAGRTGGTRVPLASVMYYNNVNTGPQANPDTAEDFYNLQRGRWLDGTRLVTGADGYYNSGGADAEAPTPFAFSGTPPDFWSEYDTQPAAGAQPNTPGDRRSIQSFGPFTMQEGETIELGVAVLWARSDAGAIASRDALVAQADELFDGAADPEPVFGNALAPLTVTVPQNQTTILAFPLTNPGGADLTYGLGPGAGPGTAFLDLEPGGGTLEPGAIADVFIEVDPMGAAVGTYAAEILVASNDRNVVTGSIPVTINVTMAVDAEDGASGRFALDAPRPNPSAGITRLRFETAAAGPVRLSVVDMLGREVVVAVDGERAAGAHHADLDVAALPAGAYVVRLSADGQQATQRLTVVR